MGTTASNQGAQIFFNNLGHAITSDLEAAWDLASCMSGLLSNGISCLLLPIRILAGLYIISQKFQKHIKILST